MKNQTDYIKQLCNKSIEDIIDIRNIAVKNNLLDEQFFLDYLDELNKLSIDPER